MDRPDRQTPVAVDDGCWMYDSGPAASVATAKADEVAAARRLESLGMTQRAKREATAASMETWLSSGAWRDRTRTSYRETVEAVQASLPVWTDQFDDAALARLRDAIMRRSSIGTANRHLSNART